MSHSFYISPVESLSYDDVIRETGLSDISFVDGYPVDNAGKWPEGYTYVYLDDTSVRALEVEFENNALKVRIFAASSPQDYQLAIKLTAAVAKLCNANIEPEDNDELSLSDFEKEYDLDWIEQHCNDTMEMVLGRCFQNPDTKCTLVGVGKPMVIGPRVIAQLKSHVPRVWQEYIKRFKKLNYIDKEDIYQSSIITLGNKEGDKLVRMSSWAEGVPTLLWDKNTLVTLSGPDDITVPLSKLPEIVGEEAVWLSEDILLVPEISGPNWSELTGRAKSEHVEDIFDYSYSPDNDPFASEESNNDSTSENSMLDDEDYKVLAYAPVAVFFIVAGADGKIDNKEARAFQKEVVAGMVAESEIMQRSIIYTLANFEDIFAELQSQKVNMKEKLEQIIAILDTKTSEDEALKFKISLLTIGKSIAEASGGFLGIFGSKISKKEKQALAMLAVFLGVVDAPKN